VDDAHDSSATLPERFGRYQVVAAIQGGNMGRLYLAQDPDIDRRVVVKALEADASQEQKQRFLREARAAGRLNHPNVVSIFDVGEQDRTPFIVMEYIEGETLAGIIRHREPILFTRRLEIIDQLCAGLAYAHDLGVVHRDIKPSNVMIDRTGKLRILDFGIARLDAGEHTQTSAGIIGTLNYMSPEQWEGGTIEGRSDMFSVGAVTYELFSFTRAFPGSTAPEVLRVVFGDGPRPLREVCPLAPPELEAVVARMMARAPADRYQNLHDVREALAGVRPYVQDAPADVVDRTVPMGAVRRPGAPSGATIAPGGGATRAQPSTATASPGADTPPSSSRRIVLVAGAVLVLALGGWLAWRGMTKGAPPPATPATPAGTTTGAASTAPGGPAVARPAAGQAALTPQPAAPIDLVVSWSLPFEVSQNGTTLTASESATQRLKGVHPDRGELYADSRKYRLHVLIPAKAGSVRIPQPGRLAVTMTPALLVCTVVVDGQDLAVGSIVPDRPEVIAAGRHRVALRCPKGLTAPPEQIAEVTSGLEPTEVKFVPDGGG